jgi:hypothetical protein
MHIGSIAGYLGALPYIFSNQRPFAGVRVHELSIVANWEVLGPFQIGTREHQWGADPLEAYGGFRNIPYDASISFPSSLNGTVRFNTIPASDADKKNGIQSRKISVIFPYVDWNGLQRSFGWSGLQFQAWIRGSLHVTTEARYRLWIGNAVEFYLNGICYDTGNLYDVDVLQFARGGVFINLSPGEHTLEIRVVNDIRAFGGQVPPKVDVQVALRKVAEDLVVAGYDA